MWVAAASGGAPGTAASSDHTRQHAAGTTLGRGSRPPRARKPPRVSAGAPPPFRRLLRPPLPLFPPSLLSPPPLPSPLPALPALPTVSSFSPTLLRRPSPHPLQLFLSLRSPLPFPFLMCSPSSLHPRPLPPPLLLFPSVPLLLSPLPPPHLRVLCTLCLLASNSLIVSWVPPLVSAPLLRPAGILPLPLQPLPLLCLLLSLPPEPPCPLFFGSLSLPTGRP